MSRAGRVNDNLNLSRAIGDVVYKRNRLREAKDQIISAEPDVCRCDALFFFFMAFFLFFWGVLVEISWGFFSIA